MSGPGPPEGGRGHLTPAQEAEHIARRKELYEALHPETKHGGDRRSERRRSSSHNENLKPDAFTKATAGSTGRSRQTVSRAAARGNALGADLLDRIAGISLDKGAELDALAFSRPSNAKTSLCKPQQAGHLTDSPPTHHLNLNASLLMKSSWLECHNPQDCPWLPCQEDLSCVLRNLHPRKRSTVRLGCRMIQLHHSSFRACDVMREDLEHLL